MTIPTEEELLAIKNQVDKGDETTFGFDPGETTIDENNVVTIRDAQGRDRIWMHKSDWEQIVNWSNENVTPT